MNLKGKDKSRATGSGSSVFRTIRADRKTQQAMMHAIHKLWITEAETSPLVGNQKERAKNTAEIKTIAIITKACPRYSFPTSRLMTNCPAKSRTSKLAQIIQNPTVLFKKIPKSLLGIAGTP
jgi:hypothetical protein